MRLLFMGTPDIAVPVLRELAKRHEIVGVFCQPDRPSGRRMTLTTPPTKLFAQQLGIPVFQPTRMRAPETRQLMESLAPDAAAVIAYGRILPQQLLEVPALGCVNAHASLLPVYRGAAPIQRAIMAGETETGITAMLMDPGMDTGDILAVRRVPILPEDNAVTMFQKLGEEAAELMVEVFSDLPAYIAARTPQDHQKATLAPMLEKQEGEFSFSGLDSTGIVNLVRGTAIWPVARFSFNGRWVKVFSAAALPEAAGEPGRVLSLKPLTIAAASGAVQLLEVMPENSRRMDGTAFAAGQRLRVGDRVE